MRPRPRARGPGRTVTLPAPEALAQQIADVRDAGGEPAAILAGPREWRRYRNLVGADELLEFWPGGDITMQRVPIIVRVGFDAPTLIGSQAELEDILLSR